jgi:hypothetical protein
MAKEFSSYEDFRRQLESTGIPGMIKAWRKSPLPSRILREALDQHADDQEVLRFLAEYPMTPADIVEKLCEKDLPSAIASAICQHPRASLEVFNFAKDHPEATVRAAVCANKSLPTRILQLMVEDPQAAVRAAVASSPLLKSNLQARLASDADSTVRGALAANPRLETEVALLLAVDPSPLVRATTALLAPVSAEILREWAVSGDLSIEDALFGREDLAAEDGAWLIFSSNASTRRQAAARWANHPMVRTRMALSDDEKDRCWQAQQKDLSRSLQEFLAEDPCAEVQQLIAEHPQLATAAMHKLRTSDSLEIQQRLALNPAVPIQELQSSEHSNGLRIHCLYREDLPEETLKNWVQEDTPDELIDHLAWMRADLPWLTANAASHLCISQRPLRRRLAATSRQLPNEAIERLCTDSCNEVREALAQNPAISEIVLDELSFDPDESVASTAKKYLKIRKKKARAAASMRDEAEQKKQNKWRHIDSTSDEEIHQPATANWFQRLRLKLYTTNIFSE